ncbi:MAG: DUF512 domain-containing protein [Chloroflexota bacterium]
MSAVAEGSPAAQAGIQAGDELLAVNGEAVCDLIDYRFLTEADEMELEVRRGDRILSRAVSKSSDEELGLEFAAATFDGVRRCQNRCRFCFVDRMRPGLRRSLYLKDDDYRYSFLFGNYVTLTNLREDDWQRLAKQRLSPLHVSVHATDLELRRRLLGNPEAPNILAQLRRLASLRISVHAQIVLCPELNDGAALDQTIGDLAELASAVDSVAIVPVGLTAFGPENEVRRFSETEMRQVITQVSGWQRRMRRGLGRTFVHLADEFYLRAGAGLPSARHYDGFPQYENGIGMARLLLDEWQRARRRLRPSTAPQPSLSLVCGQLIAPLLGRIVDELAQHTGANLSLYAVANNYFGPAVTVSGLLSGTDVLAALRKQSLGDLLVLPRAMFDSDGNRTLDEMDVTAIAGTLGVPTVTAGSVTELIAILNGTASAASQAI